MIQFKTLSFFFVVFFGFVSTIKAEPISAIPEKNLELSLQLGLTMPRLGNSVFRVTETEIDNVRQSHNPWRAQWAMGVGHAFSRLRLGLNFYYQSHGLFDTNTTGYIEQLQDANFTNYQYQLALKSQRLMLDGAWDLIQIQQVTLFLTGGLGYGHVSLAYEDFPNADVFGGNLILNPHNSHKFASEVGIGARYSYTPNTTLFADYMYTHFGHVSVGSQGYLNGSSAVIAASPFRLSTQALMLGLRFCIF